MKTITLLVGIMILLVLVSMFMYLIFSQVTMRKINEKTSISFENINAIYPVQYAAPSRLASGLQTRDRALQ